MNVSRFVGIDPGLVHTGCVVLTLLPDKRLIHVHSHVVVGPREQQVKDYLDPFFNDNLPMDLVTIEGYRRRSNFGTDPEMTAAIQRFKQALPKAQVLDNMGVKKVVTQELMELLGVWKFQQKTHHQDLRSAARIGIFGALKDERLNAVLSEVVADHLAGNSWRVH